MVESGECRDFHGGYGVDGGISEWKLEDVGPVALKFATFLKTCKMTKIINRRIVDPCHEIPLCFFSFFFLGIHMLPQERFLACMPTQSTSREVFTEGF